MTLGGVRPSRRPRRGLLEMRKFFNAAGCLRHAERHPSRWLHAIFGLALTSLLTVCADLAPPTKWVKAGVDDQSMARELEDCTSQANIALARQQGINQDISATLGRNWQLSQTTSLMDQSMSRQAGGAADQVLNSCMRSKGFTRVG